jgi:sialate O-acetylesterase
MSSKGFSLRLLAVAAAAAGAGAIRLSRTLGDHMVLQRDTPAPVWGFDTPGATVSTTFGGAKLSATAGADGVWRIALPPTPAGGPYTLEFASSVSGSVSATDVLFGDVYLCGGESRLHARVWRQAGGALCDAAVRPYCCCSAGHVVVTTSTCSPAALSSHSPAGQSNMEFTVSSAFNASAEIAAANYPNIRIFTVGQGNSSKVPLFDLASVEQNWTAATPQSVGRGEWTTFSALCYFFGRDVFNALGGSVPLGLVSNNWGGTCLQYWAAPAVSSACNMDATPILYNAMIVPYMVGPMALTGFLWAQGECNADSSTSNYYACAFGRFIDDWRTSFGNPGAFFGFELLPAYTLNSTLLPVDLPYERAALLTGLSRGANVITASALDLGDPKAPHGSVHPRLKQQVGARFAAAALSQVYGRPVPYRNPAYKAAAAVTTGTTATVTVYFDQATLGTQGLTIVPNECPTALGILQAACSWTEIQTVDGKWYNATAAVGASGTTLTLTATLAGAGGVAVNATRSSFSQWPVVTIFTADAHLPALPWFARVDSAVVA